MRRLLFSIIFLLGAVTLSAQGRYEDIVRHNQWNLGENMAGLRCDTISSSYAELYGIYDGGGFKRTHESDNAWTVGARMRSIYHLKRVSFAGGFGFERFMGANMCGSMFVEPGRYPVDILEFTPGRKNLERYMFDGGVAVEAGHNIVVGLRAEIEADSYAKRKDLRHKNNALDLRVQPSLTWRFDDGAIGATYIFSKQSEQISASTYGISSDSYYAFFDKGLSYGAYEVWDSNGIHLSEAGISGFPIREYSNGAMLQAEWHGIYADVKYAHSSGRTGEKRTFWHGFSANSIDAHIGATIAKRWFIRGAVNYRRQLCNENVLNTVNHNGVTVTESFGSNAIFSRRSLRSSIEGEYFTEKWQLTVGASYENIDRLSTLIYPQWRSQSMHRTELFVRSRVSIKDFDITATLRGATGAESSKEGQVADIQSGDYPTRLDDYFTAENEHFTASRIGCSLGLRYNIHKFFIDLQGDYTQAFGLKYINDANRWSVRLGAGYRF